MPNRLRSFVNGQSETIWIGSDRYTRDHPGGPWRVEKGGPPIPVPSFFWDCFKPSSLPASLGRAMVDGVPTTIVSFTDGQAGTPIWFRLWIDPQGFVRRAEMRVAQPPRPRRPEITLVDPALAQRILEAVKGTPFELPAAFALGTGIPSASTTYWSTAGVISSGCSEPTSSTTQRRGRIEGSISPCHRAGPRGRDRHARRPNGEAFWAV